MYLVADVNSDTVGDERVLPCLVLVGEVNVLGVEAFVQGDEMVLMAC